MSKRPPNRILELRKAAGLSLDALAERLNWQKTKVQRLETGATVLGLDDMRALAAALGVRPSELLNDEDVEYRAGENEQLIAGALADVGPDDRELFLSVCEGLTRLMRRTSPRRNAVALSGNRAHAVQLAEIWNELDDFTRARALEFLRGAALLRAPQSSIAVAAE